MTYMTIHSMATLQHAPMLDQRIVRRGAATVVAIAACIALVAALV